MTTDCRPPDNTPAGTTCWLYYDPPDHAPRQWIALIWHPPDVWSGVYDVGINRASRFGWRFHSIATPPHD